ncbi:MAG: uracil-DNA glycosylase family protein [Chitinophagales bacterium]
MSLTLYNEIMACTHCADKLPHAPRPVVQFSEGSRICIVGQAPGKKVHLSGIPWDDRSGDILRDWMQVSKAMFYDPDMFALVPMGFCYPGKGRSGDLPPRPECAPLWHERIMAQMPNLKLILLIGSYAHAYYLGDGDRGSVTENVQHFARFLPAYFPLVHPSPRNGIWLRKNPWFAGQVLPVLRQNIQMIISGGDGKQA